MEDYRSASGERRLWFSVGEIEDIMEGELRRAGYMPTASDPVVDLEKFLEFGLRVKLDVHAPLEPGVLGTTDFVRNNRPLVSIQAGLTDEAEKEYPLHGTRGRWRATLAHEGAHVVLHRRLFEAPAEQGSLFDLDEFDTPRMMRCLARDVSFRRCHSDWKEVQANYGMAALLMPAGIFRAVVREIVGANRRGGTIPPVPDPEPGAFRDFVADLSRCCGVSQQAARIRLETLGLVPAEAVPMLRRLPTEARG